MGGLILLYHRVAPPGCDPFGLRVAPERFRAQLRLLRRLGTPLPLEELVARARTGALPPHSVAVTFDDGSPDLLEHALPALEDEAVPATLFAATRPTNRRDYWWEELASLLLRPGTLPPTLELSIARRRRSWDLAGDASYPAERAARHTHWRAFDPEPPTRRHALYESLWALLRPMAPAARERAMARLRHWAGARERRATARARALTPAELRRMVASPLLTLGAHTHSHPVLAALSPEEQRHEIEGSRARLQASVGTSVQAFAYPFGSPGSFTPETVRLVRAAGIPLACTTRPGHVLRSTDRRRLPRVAVGDWGEEDFERWFLAWTERPATRGSPG